MEPLEGRGVKEGVSVIGSPVRCAKTWPGIQAMFQFSETPNCFPIFSRGSTVSMIEFSSFHPYWY